MKFHSSQSGFSLVETLVAITLLLIVIVGPMTIFSTASRSSSFASDQVIAFFLAQEGVELAQKARDDIVLNRFLDTSDVNYNATPWADFSDETGTYQACFTGAGCGLQSGADNGDPVIVDDCSSYNCDLFFDDGNGNIRARYTYTDTGSETPYRRRVTFENISASEVRIVSTVEWFSGQVRDAQSVRVETVLIDVYGP